MLHVELRQFPHTARAFNLPAEEVRARIVAPWLRGQVVELDGQQFAPERAKLKIYEGPELQTAELGMGRGWQNAMRSGQDVTERELATGRGAAAGGRPTEPRRSVGALKDELLALCEVGSVSVPQALALAGGANPKARVSERLAVAELAVWELLHERKLRMLSDGEPVTIEAWEGLLLAPATWLGSAARVVLVANQDRHSSIEVG